MLVLDRESLVKRNVCCPVELSHITNGKTEKIGAQNYNCKELYSANNRMTLEEILHRTLKYEPSLID